MRIGISLVFLIFFLTGYLSLGQENLHPEELKPVMDKILNPLPEYDPFDNPDKTLPTPKFFPDKVDKHTRKAFIDSLTNREAPLEDHVRFLKAKDAELKKENGTVTGLTEHVLDLSNNMIQDRGRFIESQKNALGDSPSPQTKKLIESRLRNDDLTRANELLKISETNRWGGRLNRLLRSVDLMTILSGSYVGAAVDTTMSQLVGGNALEMSVEERKALTLFKEHLKRYPDDPNNENVEKVVETLEKLKKRILVQQQVDMAEEAIEKGEQDKALFHYEIAAVIDPDSSEVKNGLEKLEAKIHEQEKAREKALTVSLDQPSESTDQEEDQYLSELLYALTLKDQNQIKTYAAALKKKHKGKRLAQSAKDASAVALEIRGEHERAKKILQEIADSSDSPHESARARLLLESPEYNLLASFHSARSEHRAETAKYVLLGEDLLKKNLLMATGPLITAGPAGATAIAAVNAIMIGGNFYRTIVSDPVSYQPVLDKGVAYIRNQPNSSSAQEVYRILADAYEKKGMLGRAIAYYQLSGSVDEERIVELKEKAGELFLKAAKKSGQRHTKAAYLRKLLEEYPETDAAKEATRKLASLAKIENQGLRISKKFLLENPEFYGPEGLGLKKSLFDGNLDNMELANRGVNFLGNREVLLNFQTPWGIKSRTYWIGKESIDRFQMAMRKKNYKVAMDNVHARSKGSPGGMKSLPASILREELAPEEGEAGETTFTFVRKASGASPSFPKVLDHDLLSENERDPNIKYKIPKIQGSISSNRLNVSGAIPTGLWGDRVAIGTDAASPFAGVQLPIPLLKGFIPIDFLFQGSPGRFSIFPRIHIYKNNLDDSELYQ